MSSVFFEESLVAGLQDSLSVSRPPRLVVVVEVISVVVVVDVVGVDSVVVVVVAERRFEECSACVLEVSERVALRGDWVVEVVEGGVKEVVFAVGEAAKAPQKDEAIVVEGPGAAVVVVHVVMGFVAVVAVVSVAMESVVVAVAGVVGLGQASLCIATI